MTRFTVNNQPVEYRLDPQTPLLWALRDASNLTGSKYGCDDGSCGACTVDIDGSARRSCSVAIGAIEGSFVTTIEGLSRDRSHPVQAALIASNVPQCGYCIPGIAVAAAALLRRDPSPDAAAIRNAIDHLCRCGIQPRLVDALTRAAALMRGDETVTVAAPPDIDRDEAARTVPALAPSDGSPSP